MPPGPLSLHGCVGLHVPHHHVAGSRRGAMMATLRCDHPDIEAFIDAKREPGRLRMFNLSVLVTDAFMAAVKADAPWDSVFDGTRLSRRCARAICGTASCASTYDYAEPGVIFIDRINAQNNLAYCETIHATNPCGEQPLPPYGACLLGSINLARLVKDPFERRRRDSISTTLSRPDARRPCASWTMSSTSRAFRSPRRRTRPRAKRRIGLGVTGLADALIFCRVRYGSPRQPRADRALAAPILSDAAYRAVGRARRGERRLPALRREAYLARPTCAALPEDIRDGHRRARHPQRAAHLDRADRHDLAVRRQCLERHRAGLRLHL